jgi:hypothetical protein
MDDQFADWKHNGPLGWLLMSGMREFAVGIISCASHGKILDDAAIATVKTQCLQDLKKADFTGLPIEEQAHIIGQALRAFEQLMDSAVRDGRKL